jgi:hypothetical protein
LGWRTVGGRSGACMAAVWRDFGIVSNYGVVQIGDWRRGVSEPVEGCPRVRSSLRLPTAQNFAEVRAGHTEFAGEAARRDLLAANRGERQAVRVEKAARQLQWLGATLEMLGPSADAHLVARVGDVPDWRDGRGSARAVWTIPRRCGGMMRHLCVIRLVDSIPVEYLAVQAHQRFAAAYFDRRLHAVPLGKRAWRSCALGRLARTCTWRFFALSGKKIVNRLTCASVNARLPPSAKGTDTGQNRERDQSAADRGDRTIHR